MCLVFVTKIPDRRQNWVGRRATKGTERAILDGFAKVPKKLQVVLFAASLGDIGEYLESMAQTLATWCTFAAAFLCEKARVVAGNLNHTIAIIHDDESAGAHHGTFAGERVKVYRHIEFFHGETSAGRPTDLNRLERSALFDATTDVIDKLPE